MQDCSQEIFFQHFIMKKFKNVKMLKGFFSDLRHTRLFGHPVPQFAHPHHGHDNGISHWIVGRANELTFVK